MKTKLEIAIMKFLLSPDFYHIAIFHNSAIGFLDYHSLLSIHCFYDLQSHFEALYFLAILLCHSSFLIELNFHLKVTLLTNLCLK